MIFTKNECAYLIVLLIISVTILNTISDPYYNRPILCSYATWNVTPITFATNQSVGDRPWGLFINTQDSIYATNRESNTILVWNETNMTIASRLVGGLSCVLGLFLTSNGDMYVSSYNTTTYRVDKRRNNATAWNPVMYTEYFCVGLFLDQYDNIYCSMRDLHQVLKRHSNDSINSTTIIAGTGINGSAANMLSSPCGIFVTNDLNLYVADCDNDRVQLFYRGQRNATTVVGTGAPGTINLDCPASVILDADGSLYITDYFNNRIIRSRPNDHQCIVGCSLGNNTLWLILSYPANLQFDSDGNIFVTDHGWARIQKFFLASNSCDATATAMTTWQTSSSSSSITTMTNHRTGSTASQPFLPSTCPNVSMIGVYCNISSSPCEILRPCQNNATCENISVISVGYRCLCPPDFSGQQCEVDHRPCQPNTCWNDGLCKETSNTTFECQCEWGWQGDHCEEMVNYCANVTCENKGVCRPSLLNYSCQCLGESYFGRHCEIVSGQIRVHEAMSQSFAYIAIVALLSVAIFIITMDVLQYVFKINPVEKELTKLRRVKMKAKRVVAIRYIYLNAPAVSNSRSSMQKSSDLVDARSPYSMLRLQ